MRVVVSLEGQRPLVIEGREVYPTRHAIGHLGFETLHVLAVEPASPEIPKLREIVERMGAVFEADAVPADDLLAAFAIVCETLERYEGAASRSVAVNAGPDANLLSAAGLLACIHVGVEAHFIDERGHRSLPVLTPAPLRAMLSRAERDALAAFPSEGIPVEEIGGHPAGPLHGLRKRRLIGLVDGRLLLTDQGASYREHVR